MDIHEVKERIETLYAENGSYFEIIKEENESWAECFKRNNFTDDEIVFLKELVSDEWEGTEIKTESFAEKLCSFYNYYLELWESKQVFDSCGLDIFVMNFIIVDNSTNEKVLSGLNVYKRY